MKEDTLRNSLFNKSLNKSILPVKNFNAESLSLCRIPKRINIFNDSTNSRSKKKKKAFAVYETERNKINPLSPEIAGSEMAMARG